MTTKTRRALAILLLCAGVASLHAVGADSETNSLGMTLVRIEPGTFPLGSAISSTPLRHVARMLSGWIGSGNRTRRQKLPKRRSRWT